MASKKANPGYVDLRGHVPRELIRRFRIYALDNGLNHSQALETLLRERFDPDGEISVGDAVNAESAQN